MTKNVQIDFVSDVVCPWCVIGLRELERALARVADVIQPTIHLQPYELNPSIPAEGQAIVDIYKQKFGKTFDQMAAGREGVRARANDVGFKIVVNEQTRIPNTFNAHRLLHWAELKGKQIALKHALFTAHFTEGRNIADHEVLIERATSVGLDSDEARKVLADGLYGEEVKAAEQMWQSSGINSVPAIVINRKHLISGGQTAAVFEATLRKIAAET